DHANPQPAPILMSFYERWLCSIATPACTWLLRAFLASKRSGNFDVRRRYATSLPPSSFGETDFWAQLPCNGTCCERVATLVTFEKTAITPGCDQVFFQEVRAHVADSRSPISARSRITSSTSAAIVR